MKIENDEIMFDAGDLSKLSSETQTALAEATSTRTVLLRLPGGKMEPAEYLSAAVNTLLESARNVQVGRRFDALRQALEEADATKRSQAEALIEQAEAAVGVS